MTVGNPALWSDIFPEALVPEILDLVCSAWATFKKPQGDELEVPITLRFKCALQQARTYRGLPIRIEREVAEDDTNTASELGRIDLKLSPAESAVEDVYFAFECKRLYALVNGAWEALVSKYVDEGMSRFVTGQYSRRMKHGGMIAYVLNGDTPKAKRQVQQNLTGKCDALRLQAPAKLAPSGFHASIDDIRETTHHLDGDRAFRLHHVFLGGTKPALLSPPPTPEVPVPVKSSPRKR